MNGRQRHFESQAKTLVPLESVMPLPGRRSLFADCHPQFSGTSWTLLPRGGGGGDMSVHLWVHCILKARGVVSPVLCWVVFPDQNLLAGPTQNYTSNILGDINPSICAQSQHLQY